ncbi:DUF5615 family PIN-like protein [Mesorhizobium sp. Cs1299R1N1]
MRSRRRGREARHVNWLALSGETDWDLISRIIAEDFTFVTNNARDFRKLYAREEALEDGAAVLTRYDLPSAEAD